ncbi:unnamed protein product [Discula destructiva]
MDEATSRLILQLQTEDVETLSRNGKGKQRQGEVDDFAYALQLYQTDLEATSTSVSDSQMAASLAQAARRDGALVTELMAQESQAAQDRRIALAINEGQDADTAFRAHAEAPANGHLYIDDDLLDSLAALNVVHHAEEFQDDDGEIQTESSSWAASRPRPSTTTPQRQCVICMGNFPEHNTARAPCGDSYCRPCLVELFTRSLTDESLFPPRCHGQHIPAETHRDLLGAPLLGRFLAQKLEFETPNRTYCYRPQCTAFIPPQFVHDEVARCVRCGDSTCAICKKRTHSGDCPEDTATQDLLSFAQEAGWQRCYSCRRLVELRTGCNHITCRCNAQFCYVCAAPWKTCDCEQWHEERLLERANVLVDRERAQVPAAVPAPVPAPIHAEEEEYDGWGYAVGPRPRVASVQFHYGVADFDLDSDEDEEPEPQPAPEPDYARQRRLEQVRQQLLDDHDCEHVSWRRIGGPRNCEECGDRMPLWLNVCKQCSIMVCRRCKLNRL